MERYKKGLMSTMLLSILTFTGCGDDEAEAVVASGGVTTTETGVFLDSAVAGISYETQTQSGVTDENGTFKYIQGEVVTFKIGDIALPPATAGAIVTPLTLADTTDINNTIVSNITRLLQTVDSDGNASNGISIAAATLSAGLNQTVDFNTTNLATEVNTFLSSAGIDSANLVTETEALAHLSNTIDGLPINTAKYSFQKSEPYNLRIYKNPNDASYTEEEYNDYSTAGKLVRTQLKYTDGNLTQKRILYFDLNVSNERRFTKMEQIYPSVRTWGFDRFVLRQYDMVLGETSVYAGSISRYSDNNLSAKQYADFNQTVTVVNKDANATYLNSAYSDCIIIDQNRTTSGLLSNQDKAIIYCLGIGKTVRVSNGVTVELDGSIVESATDLVPQ